MERFYYKSYSPLGIVFYIFLMLQGLSHASTQKDCPILLPEHLFSELDCIIANLPRNAPDARMHRERIAEAKGLQIASASAVYPKFTGNVRYTYTIEDRSDLSGNKGRNFGSGNAALVQPLYTWGAVSAERRIGQIGTAISKCGYNQAMAMLTNQIRELYLGLYKQRLTQKISQEGEVIARKNVAEMEHKCAQGMITQTQFQEAQLAHDEILLKLEASGHEQDYYETLLRRLSCYEGPLFENMPSMENILASIHCLTTDADPALQVSCNERYTVLEKQLNIERLNYVKTRAQQLPLLSFVTGVFQDEVDAPNDPQTIYRTNYYVGVQLKWNIFDGFQARGLKIASKAKQRRLKTEMRQERARFELETYKTQDDLSVLKKVIKLRVARLEIANNQFVTQKRFLDEGKMTASDFLKAKISRDQVEVNLVESIIDYFNALSSYYAETGSDPSLS